MTGTTHPVDGAPARRVAAEAYYWKPGTAWFRSLELTEYLRLGLRLGPPVLDLGCGDGRVSWMLNRLDLVAAGSLGTDYSAGQLRLAARSPVYRGLVQGDAGRLPFADGAFRSVLCNGVICSIPGDFRLVLSEIHRVLQPGGRAVVTVPTDRFNEVLLWPRALGRISPRLRVRYERAMDARQPHYWKLSATGWRSELEAAGFDVAETRPFFGRPEGRLYNLLSMHVLRVFAILKSIDGPAVRAGLGGSLAALLRRPFERSLEREGPVEGTAGYVLFDVRRP